MFEFIGALSAGLDRMASLDAGLALVAGTVFGLIFGFIPGLQSITALVVVLPLTFGLDPIVGMYVFAGIIGSAGRGGSIPAIALNMPGTAQNAATTLDGYPLARQGRVSWALGVAASASLLGASAGLITLIVVIPVFIPFLLAFGPAEQFWIMTFGLIAMSVALPGPFLKGLVAVGIGIVLAGVGLGGPYVEVPRFTFGSEFLLDGVHIVAVIIGLLVVSEAIGNLADRPARRGSEARHSAAAIPEAPAGHWRETWDGILEPLRHPRLLLQSSAIGTLIGAVPGVGGTVAQFFSYNAAYATSRRRERFGKGSVEGLIAAETAVDAKEGGTLMPTLLFGIPGNGEMALVLAAWEMHGLQAGPFFLAEHSDLAWALILGLVGANVLSTGLTVGGSSFAARIPRMRPDYIALAVVVMSILAVLSVRQNLWDVAVVIGMGVFGYMLKGLGIPVIGAVIGFVIGGLMEENFYTTLQMGRGDYAAFVSSEISAVLCAASVFLIVFVVLRRRRAWSGNAGRIGR